MFFFICKLMFLTSMHYIHLQFCSILFYSILFYSVLFCSLLFCSILFYSILFYSVLFCSLLFCSILFYSTNFKTTQSITSVFERVSFSFCLFIEWLCVTWHGVTCRPPTVIAWLSQFDWEVRRRRLWAGRPRHSTATTQPTTDPAWRHETVHGGTAAAGSHADRGAD